MKKLNVLFFAIAAMAIGFTSCKPSEPAVPPTLTISPSTEQLAAEGATVTFTLNCSSDVELKTLAVSASTVGGANSGFQDNATEIQSKTATEVTFVKSNMSATGIMYDYVVPAGQGAGTVITLTFTLTDKDANATITGTVKVGTAAPTMNTFNATLTAQATTAGSTNKSFFDAADGLTYLYTTATTSDLAFMRHSTLKAGAKYSLRSPDDASLVTIYSANSLTYSTSDKNTTKLEKKTGIVWADVTGDYLSTLTVATGSIVTDLVEGDFVAFKTEDGLVGIAKIGAQVDGSIYGLSTMVIDVKVTATPVTK